MIRPWLRFFRVVNLPTVPGDVLVGAAMVGIGSSCASPTSGLETASPLLAACLASVFLYLFGLADNDIVGVAEDENRPIPNGQISLRAARVARGLCLFVPLVVASLANLPPMWWIAAFALTLAIVIYNRTKGPAMMGLCRGLNVVGGGAVFCASLTSGQETASPFLLLGACALVWTLYIGAVTKYSEGEESDAAKRQRVGFLIGGIVYLQLFALVTAYLMAPTALTRHLLFAGAGLLIVLRLMKRLLSGVSAS